MVLRLATIDQQFYRTIRVTNDGIQITVIVDVADGRPAADSRELK